MLEGCVKWPEQRAESYRAAGYWRGQTLGDLLRVSAARDPGGIALVEGSRRMTYGELEEEAGHIASGLLGLGLTPGDRVVVHMPNSVELVASCWGLFQSGVIPVFALPAHRRSEIEYLCRASGAKGYLTVDRSGGFDHLELGTQLRRVQPTLEHVIAVGGGRPRPGVVQLLPSGAESVTLPAIDPTEVAFFLLSGGTTGRPKLIPRTHDDYAYNVRRAVEVSAMHRHSVQLVGLPMTHNGALGCPGFLGSLVTGSTAVLTDDPSPNTAFRLIAVEAVTLTTVVPPLAALWLDALAARPADVSSLGLLQIGGARLAPELAARVGPALGCALQQWYGLGEGFLACTRLDDDPDLIVSTQGRPLSPADEMRVVDRDGEPAAAGEIGELLVRGPTTFCGYYDAASHNREVFTGDGFFHTGDLVRQLETGHLIVSGRVKDVIIRAGEKVAAEEVEDELLGHPAIAEVALVGAPDPVVGERVCAFVRTYGEDLGLREVAQFLRERGVAAYKIPERLELVDQFPLTAVGKVAKAELRRRLES